MKINIDPCRMIKMTTSVIYSIFFYKNLFFCFRKRSLIVVDLSLEHHKDFKLSKLLLNDDY